MSSTTTSTFTSQQIADALHIDVNRVQAHWPGIRDELARQGMADLPTTIAAVATTMVECGFNPRSEAGTGVQWARYDNLLGNNKPGDGKRYRGRGYVQLTFRGNYREYGQLLGLPLEDNPDLANEPGPAARILVAFLKRKGVPALAARGDWTGVRKAVQGADGLLKEFLGFVSALQQVRPGTAIVTTPDSPVTGGRGTTPAQIIDPVTITRPAPTDTGWPAYPGEAVPGDGMGDQADQADKVRVWQAILIQAGEIGDTAGNRDGTYGPGMVAKITALQTGWWGPGGADGKAGPKTYEMITGHPAG